VRRIEWGAGLVIRAFIYYSLLLYANGKLDRSAVTDRPSEVRAVATVQAPFGGVTPHGWLTLRSSDDPARTMRILLRPHERGAFWVGEAVVVELRRGALWVPWVANVVEDRNRRDRAILEVAPRAAMAWRDLVRFNLDRSRWGEAVTAAQEYFAIYPKDREFMLEVADRFDMAEQPARELEVLDPLMRQASPDAALFLSYGLALSRAGRKAEAVEWLRKAVELAPSRFWTYYHLGHTLRDLGRVAEAIEVYERAQALKPGYPEIESDLALLRKAVLPKPR
jgi:tetratricopeptide (TPR) repeat protein